MNEPRGKWFSLQISLRFACVINVTPMTARGGGTLVSVLDEEDIVHI
jgi:hypothetical protein